MKPLSTSIQQTLNTNIPRKIAVPLYILSFLGLLGFFIISFSLQSSDKLPFHGYSFFPDKRVERSLGHGHYENLRQAGKLYRHEPVIQSDMIVDPFVRLFIPYSPRRHNKRLDQLCPETEPLPQQGFSLRKNPPPVQLSDGHVAQALECLGQLYTIFLNDEAIAPQFDFYARPDTGVHGIITYLPTESLPEGRNILRIKQVKIDSDDTKTDEGTPVEYFIPFWI